MSFETRSPSPRERTSTRVVHEGVPRDTLSDYVREAHRCLHIDGHLYIWEAASYFEDVRSFAAALAKLRLDISRPSIEGAFVRICALKNRKKPDGKLVLPFGGANKA